MRANVLQLLIFAFPLAAADQHCSGFECDGTTEAWFSLLQKSKLNRLALSEGVATQGEEPEHYWVRRGGNIMMNSYTPHTAPSNFSAGPTWVWNNSLDEQVRHSPLIDKDFNIYVSTATRILKFTKHGDLLWTWVSGSEDGNVKMVSCPHLVGKSIYTVLGASRTDDTVMYSIDISTGTANWRKTDKHYVNGDANSVFVHNNTMLFAVTAENETPYYEGNNKVYAVDPSDGSYKWEYQLDDIVWNFSPSATEDGNLVFASQCGGVYKLGFDGQLIWKSGRDNPGYWCGTGGGSLGPNGVFYTEFRDEKLPGSHLAAYDVSDGKQLWNRTLDYSGWQYPAVGYLGSDGPLAVVAAIGEITGAPTSLNPIIESKVDVTMPNAVVAMDAKTGEVLWRSEEEPWDHLAAAGDMGEIAQVRLARVLKDPRADFICLPDIQGIPLIAGDGTVYASSSHHGDLRAIRDRDGNGIIEPSEVSTFHTGNCFLNSPSLAPGMLVAAPCWGPMYVFLDKP